MRVPVHRRPPCSSLPPSWPPSPPCRRPPPRPRKYDATIRYTEYGIPHIAAQDYGGLGYGYGYAIAKENICVLADTYMTVRGAALAATSARTRATSSAATARRVNNLNSDFFFQQIIDDKRVEKLLAPKGTGAPEARDPHGRARLRRRLQPLAARHRRRQGHHGPGLQGQGRGSRRSPRSTPTAASTSWPCSPAAAWPSTASAARSRRTPSRAGPGARRDEQIAEGLADEFKGLAIGSNAVALGATRPRTAAACCSATRTSRGSAPSASSSPT